MQTSHFSTTSHIPTILLPTSTWSPQSIKNCWESLATHLNWQTHWWNQSGIHFLSYQDIHVEFGKLLFPKLLIVLPIIASSIEHPQLPNVILSTTLEIMTSIVCSKSGLPSSNSQANLNYLDHSQTVDLEGESLL